MKFEVKVQILGALKDQATIFENLADVFLKDVQALKYSQGTSGSSKLSRSKKKSRKAMIRLGMKPFPGVSSDTLKKSENCLVFSLYFLLWFQILYVISEPDVKSPASDTYVIFGEGKVEYLSSQLQSQAEDVDERRAERCQDHSRC
ncbi:nascent polypeptide-associated complex subunit alpha-like protein 3 [Lycium ferocissimum]|uniref:nascent polypeptide-associated complex subunit alpha-like protein 3 n=1 Tax=Lycium ferocissimum TaxID=112874 RepID=UPI0028158F4A|nr:nascent polypeptide-associated complex subunit alpha-like protein 3 [Lycium ferocissimum]